MTATRARRAACRTARRPVRLGASVAAVVVLGLTGCTSSSPDSAAPAGTGDAAITVGGGRSTEMLLMQSLYGLRLAAAGLRVDYKAADSRAVYGPALESGVLDVVPDYAATAAEYYNQLENGSDAVAVASSDAARTVEAMRPLLAARGLGALTPSRAADQNGFVVTTAFAKKERVSTLSALAALDRPVVLAASAQCAKAAFCAPGLTKTYGLRIDRVTPLGFGTADTKQAVVDGRAALGQVSTTDGTLTSLGLVALADDKKLQPAGNLVPLVNVASAGTPRVAEALDPVSAALTTADLAAMVSQVDLQRRRPLDVATAYLKAKKLL